jgi:hypothetical protein
MYVLFLSHFSVWLWLLLLFFGMAEATFIPRDDLCVQLFISSEAPAWNPPSLDHARSLLAKQCIDSKTESGIAEKSEGRSRYKNALSPYMRRYKRLDST